MVVQASMQAAEMTTTPLVMTLSVARSYRLYANNHPEGVNGVPLEKSLGPRDA